MYSFNNIGDIFGNFMGVNPRVTGSSGTSFSSVGESQSVTISDANGNTKIYTGGSVAVIDGEVWVDGKVASGQPTDATGTVMRIHPVSISINTHVDSVSTSSGNVTVNGNVGSGGVRCTSGDVKITGKVDGPVSTTSGDVDIGDSMGGSCNTTSGSVTVNGDIKGSVSTLTGRITVKRHQESE